MKLFTVIFTSSKAQRHVEIRVSAGDVMEAKHTALRVLKSQGHADIAILWMGVEKNIPKHLKKPTKKMTLYYHIEKLVNGFNQVMTVRAEVEGPKCEDIENISVSLYFKGVETDITDLLDKADLLDKLFEGIDWPMIYAETRASNEDRTND